MCPCATAWSPRMPLDADVLLLIAITLFAATVNGALGYGFSSLTVPVAVLVYANRVLNPALALMLNNQGFVREDFRASLALIRIAESTLTAIAYAFLGLYSVQTGSLVGLIAPSVIVGVPLGAYLIRRLAAETFRRICMSFDA